MDVALVIFFSCLALGAVSGFLAGLLGIGGGLVIVPVLIALLPLTSLDPHLLMPMVLGTSLAAILLTSISALLAHRRAGNIPLKLLPPLIVGIGAGALCGSYFADAIASDTLKLIFAVFVIMMALQMWFGAKKPDLSIDQADVQPHRIGLLSVSFFVGGLSSLLGVGGGIMMVPFLTWSNIRMLRAVGASAACGLAVASMGSLGYLWAGLHTPFQLPQWSFGYIYLPALSGIIAVSLFTAPMGVKIAKLLPIKLLKRGFSILLFLVGANILMA
ncbi:MAG: sulfite exporter TauE/SafE family protein [Gammaproteobacteria bacterium]|nr:sulfite exporter TauE/SafE family protein [Gammaproteobacteria bacterium]